MNALCWNVRGINVPLKLQDVLYVLKQHKIDIFGSMETKVKESRRVDLMKKFGPN